MAQVQTYENDGLSPALRSARLAEAVQAEAVSALQDAKSLRLKVLKDELAAVPVPSETVRQTFELALQPGETPRLWIDLITSVVMEPDPRTYRLVQDRETLFETTERGAMVETIKRHVAHRIIARERQIAAVNRASLIPTGYSTAALIFAWLAGFALGALALLIAVIVLGKLVI